MYFRKNKMIYDISIINKLRSSDSDRICAVVSKWQTMAWMEFCVSIRQTTKTSHLLYLSFSEHPMSQEEPIGLTVIGWLSNFIIFILKNQHRKQARLRAVTNYRVIENAYVVTLINAGKECQQTSIAQKITNRPRYYTSFVYPVILSMIFLALVNLPDCSVNVKLWHWLALQTTRSFPSLRKAVMSLPEADKPVHYLQLLAPVVVCCLTYKIQETNTGLL